VAPMNEIVFFNPGDAIASGHDFNEAMRSAEIFHRDQKQHELMIVKEVDGETYAIFNAADAQTDDTAANRYQVSKRLK
jgi:hypothetical protein